jgi:spectrin beta
MLAGALEIHLFNRDIDDTNQRVIEKSIAMNTNDTGKDLPAVEQLQRKQEAMERDMTAIEGKLKVRAEIIFYRLYNPNNSGFIHTLRKNKKFLLNYIKHNFIY